MTYSESAEGVMITRDRAILEIEAHGEDPEEVLLELGNAETYDAGDVLRALGY